jgi:translation elongation factor EF-4
LYQLTLWLLNIVTKIDLPNAQPEETALAMANAFQLDPDSVIMTSAKQRIGIEELMHAIIDRLPPPPQFDKSISNNSSSSSIEKAASAVAEAFRGRIVDSWFDEHRGVVCLVQVVSGKLIEGQVMYVCMYVRTSF